MAIANTPPARLRFVYDADEDLMPLLQNPSDPRLAHTDFGTYTSQQFEADLLSFNDGRPLSAEQRALIDGSHDVVRWLAGHGVKFAPIYDRQSFEKEGRHIFWGGLTLAAQNEGVGLIESELEAFVGMGGRIRYDCGAVDLITAHGRVIGVVAENAVGDRADYLAKGVILGCGGFEANAELRQRHIGPAWTQAKVRGTPHNTGKGLEMALELGAEPYGFYGGCHATPMDLHMKDYGNLDIPHLERKNYRKICYFLGVMVNAHGARFVDEGKDFRNYTYAQFGRAVLEQPGHFAWQIFDAKVEHLLYGEYRFHDAHFVEAETLEGLIDRLDGIDAKEALRRTLTAFNAAADDGVRFDPTIKDGKATIGLPLPKSNWAQKIDTPPFKAYPVHRRHHLHLWWFEGEPGGRGDAIGRLGDSRALCLRRAGGRCLLRWLSWRIGADLRSGVRKACRLRRRGGCRKLGHWLRLPAEAALPQPRSHSPDG